VLERIFGHPVRRVAQLTPREFATLRGAVGYVGSRLAREQLHRTGEEAEGSDAVLLLTLLARLQAEVNVSAPSVQLTPSELTTVCTALFWAARDLESYAQQMRSWGSWSEDDLVVRDWLVSNFPEAREDPARAEQLSHLARTVWLTLREQHRAATTGQTF
jgi:hypothetical protein